MNDSPQSLPMSRNTDVIYVRMCEHASIIYIKYSQFANTQRQLEDHP